MTTFFIIFLATFLVSLVSFIGIVFLSLKEKLLNRILAFLVAFSAGSLLGGAFFHLLPESLLGEGQGSLEIFIYVILGFCSFFIMEQFISWHHHHAKDHPEIKPFSYMILISDGLHNFIDGLTIAVSFLISFPLGIMTTIIIILHEIPQEISDFGVLIYGGFKKTSALILNFLSGVAAVIGGIVGFFIAESAGQSILFLLPFAAGNFIYIASSDLIPEIKNEKESLKKSLFHFLTFLMGLTLMLVLKLVGE